MPTESTDRPAFDLRQPMLRDEQLEYMERMKKNAKENGMDELVNFWLGAIAYHNTFNGRIHLPLDYSGDDVPVRYIFPDPPGPTEQELHNAKRLKIRGWWAGLVIIVTLGVVLACIIAVVIEALNLPYKLW
jgi:hypothetical protein